jgi:hypothetical protein
MSGHGDPPEGASEGAPGGGGDDEYRSVVFDESFVRAARIQEFSAQERLDEGARAVRVRHMVPHGLARQAVALLLLIFVAFGFAVYMGVRHPYKAHRPAAVPPLRSTVIALVPDGRVPVVRRSSPFAGTRAAGYKAGAAGLELPAPHPVGSFDQAEVAKALDTAKEYLADSSIDPATVLYGDVGPVRDLIDPGQLDQFDTALGRPDADGSHEVTGWLVRFDPADSVELAHGGIRVSGAFTSLASGNQLEIDSDHTFVYAVHGAGTADTGTSLFTVRRQMRFHFDHADLRESHIELVEARVQAGPLSCSTSVDGYFRPILAGGRAAPVLGTDPYDRAHSADAVCAPLSTLAEGTPQPTGTPTGTSTATTPATGSSAPPAGAPQQTATTTAAVTTADTAAQPSAVRPALAAGGPYAATAPAGAQSAGATPRAPARALRYRAPTPVPTPIPSR